MFISFASEYKLYPNTVKNENVLLVEIMLFKLKFNVNNSSAKSSLGGLEAEIVETTFGFPK